MMADRISQYMQAYTLYGSVRPFGVSLMMGTCDKTQGPSLMVVEPSGVYYGYYATASGKGKQLAKTELEKLKFSELSAREALKEAARM
jgi:20S proteasome subunit alpha 7